MNVLYVGLYLLMKWVEFFRIFVKIYENKDYEYFEILKWIVINNL